MKSLDDILKIAQNVQEQMGQAQANLDSIEVEGIAGGGLVKVRATAKGRILGVAIDESLLNVERVPPDDADIGSQPVAVTARKAPGADRFALLGKGKDRRDPRRLGRAQFAGIMAEIALRPRIGAIGADAGLRYVQVDFHDPLLAPDSLDQQCEPGLQAFPEKAAALPKKRILCRLLADRRSATDPAAACIALGRLDNRFAIESIMGAEFAILARNRRTGHVRIHCGQAHPVLVEAVSGQDIADHRERNWRWHELVDHDPEG